MDEDDADDAMSRKRPAPSPAADVVTPATSRKPDRVVLDVGGTLFTTSKNTLVANSTYFESIFREGWPDDDYFLDRDPATFALLLTYMRNGVVELPEHDESLARRVLLEAQFLGIDDFLSAIKAQAYRNLVKVGWKGSDTDAATNFDKKHGGLEDALRKGVLPARFYGRVPPPTPPPPPPPPPERKVVQIMPASHDVTIGYYDEDGNEKDVTLPALSLARVENPKSLEHAATGSTDTHELDAFVASDDQWGKITLATEAFERVRYVELIPKSTDQIIPVPQGVLQGEFWKDKNDHSKGVMQIPVQFLQVCTSPGAIPTMTPVMLHAQGDTFILQDVTKYGNYKRLAHESN